MLLQRRGAEPTVRTALQRFFLQWVSESFYADLNSLGVIKLFLSIFFFAREEIPFDAPGLFRGAESTFSAKEPSY